MFLQKQYLPSSGKPRSFCSKGQLTIVKKNNTPDVHLIVIFIIVCKYVKTRNSKEYYRLY